jgi:hypothetical protein
MPRKLETVYRVCGPLTGSEALLRGDKIPPCHSKSRAAAEVQAERLNKRQDGHYVVEGVGDRYGWKALDWMTEEERELHDGFGCEGHPAGPYDPMGQTVYCDGSCRR